MQRLEIPENFRKLTQTPQTTATLTEEDKAASDRDWEDLGYMPLLNCPECKGYGQVHPRRLDGRVDYSRVVLCEHKGCMAESYALYRTGAIIKQSGVTGRQQTFLNFDADVPGVKKAYKQAWDIAEGIGDFIWLILYGGTGNGKTHLLNAIANRAMERGLRAKMVMMADLLSELRMAMKTNETDEKMLELKKVPYLLIDELGLEYGTDWEKEKIEELFAARWANGRFTVVATNRDIEELPERIRSRFKDKYLSRWVRNEAGDFRLKRGR